MSNWKSKQCPNKNWYEKQKEVVINNSRYLCSVKEEKKTKKGGNNIYNRKKCRFAIGSISGFHR